MNGVAMEGLRSRLHIVFRAGPPLKVKESILIKVVILLIVFLIVGLVPALGVDDNVLFADALAEGSGSR
jgi:hypothetical protein